VWKRRCFVKRQMIGLNLILAFLVMLSFSFKANAAKPLETIQNKVNKVLEVLRDPALKGESNKEAKEKKIWDIAEDIFDFDELSKRTLGRDWRKLNEGQQKEFSELFSKILGGVYLDRIVAYTDEKVVFDKESMLSEDKAEVQSKIITASAEIPLNYRMINVNGNWRVYDVVIEGVSMVQNYRTQFRDILKNKTPEDLLQILREKAEKKS
jgi:phospholipid transport system substrate-binding protein